VSAALNSRSSDVRKHPRLNVRCRARIRIGKCEYAGYVEYICAGGVKIRTLSTITTSGAVALMMPDLPPVCGDLRWLDPPAGGVSFTLDLPEEVLVDWLSQRLIGQARSIADPSA
jgi:hypothetical protein